MTNEEHLGDGVYVAQDGDEMVIYLDNGYGPHSMIYVDAYVWSKLEAWVKRTRNEQNNIRQD